MTIPFLSLKKLNHIYEEEFKKTFANFLDKGYYMLSDNVSLFEKQFSEFCEANYCIGVANGLDALELIIQSYDFPQGSEIIVPANTYYASILSILNAGLKPVLVEPEISTYLIDPTTVEDSITENTVAIMAVNLYGRMCDFEALFMITKKHKLKLFVDAAQSHGAVYNGSKDCLNADAIAYSFYPTKNLGALADGGAVVTNDKQLADLIYAKRNYGSNIKYQFEYQGKNSRLSELQAGFLSVKLKNLDNELTARRRIAKRYLSEIKNDRLVLPPADRIEEDAWHLFVIRTQERDELILHLKNSGIGYDIHYPTPPHKQNALKEYNHLVLPITEEIHSTIISIPLNPTITDDEATYIINTLNSY
jgi:dTDP-4-amino-4,6-dideoxygalactose transaminase